MDQPLGIILTCILSSFDVSIKSEKNTYDRWGKRGNCYWVFPKMFGKFIKNNVT